MSKFDSILPKPTEESTREYKEMLARRDASPFKCKIPDWTGSGGMVNFWINDDGSFECEDSRLFDEDIRDGIEKMLKIGKKEY